LTEIRDSDILKYFKHAAAYDNKKKIVYTNILVSNTILLSWQH